MVKRRQKSRPVRVSGAANTPRCSSASDSVDDEMFAALASIAKKPSVLMKVCRLCETKDGPFLNIFDADKVTAKRIDEVLPFTVAENDELPHKICFRCSAKVEELYEFILKCVKTQENLQTAMGKKTPLVTKSRFRIKWENQLSKKNISNDDICNALIKKAMEGLKNSPPMNPLTTEGEILQTPVTNKNLTKNGVESPLTSKKDKEPIAVSNDITQSNEDVESDEVKLKQAKLAVEKCVNKSPTTRSSRLQIPEPIWSYVEGSVEPPKKVKQYPSRRSQTKVEPTPVDKLANVSIKMIQQNNVDNAITIASIDKNKNESDAQQIEKPEQPPAKVPDPPPINIMDHVSIIKVNSVGTLFLCKLCNRNFLKKELVLTHGCAKNNVPKDKFLHNHVPQREVPKPPTVKYIKMDKDFKKPVMPPVVTENKPVEKKLPSNVIKVNIPVQPDTKPKPKIGPASKVKNVAQPTEVPKEPTPPPVKIAPKPVEKQQIMPEVQFPAIPSLNSLYKLVPGPNNTFTLVEDKAPKPVESIPQVISDPGPKSKRKRKLMVNEENAHDQFSPVAQNQRPVVQNQGPVVQNRSISEVIDLDDTDIPLQPHVPLQPPVIQQPYPVGLFQTAHHSGGFGPTIPKPTVFTPAVKKQSYTVVQTGNPSKLLISTKPQPVLEEMLRKKSKKGKQDERGNNTEPYNVNMIDNTVPKEAGMFTFINVDPQMQPSYVLPTDNIIQESQISTSTPVSKAIADNKEREKYACNMCEETFSREKKLLAHIQSHFNQMDAEDQMRKGGPKKKTRKT